jgi:hypothetical protein
MSERLRVTNAGRVGIGTTTPATLLDVAGTLNVTGATTLGTLSATGTTLAGTTTINTTGTAATTLGNTTAATAVTINTGATGRLTLGGLPTVTTTGDDVLVINASNQVQRVSRSDFLGGSGSGAGWALTGNASTSSSGLLGAAAGGNFLGTTDGQPLRIATGGLVRAIVASTGEISVEKNLTVNGVSVGRGSGSGSSNLAVGETAMTNASTGDNNTAVGTSALRFTSGGSNVAVGSSALSGASQSGIQNVAIGFTALTANTSGGSNVAVGTSALMANTTGAQNVAMGNAALSSLSSGGRNVALGNSANSAIATANDSVFLGASARANATSQTNQIVIGYDAVGLGSNSAVLGNSSITATRLQGRVGVGLDPAVAAAADAQLQVAAGASTRVGLSVRGAASQSANLFEAQNSSGTALASISSLGVGSFAGLTVSGTNTLSGTTDINTTGTSSTTIGNTSAATGVTINTGSTGRLTLGNLTTVTATGDDVLVINSFNRVQRITRTDFLSGVAGWSLTGNAGTGSGGTLGDAPSGNFLGTTGTGGAASNLSFVTGNLIRAQIGTDGVLSTQLDIVVNGIRLGRGGGGLLGNSAFGLDALNANSTGQVNTAVGSYALGPLTSGNNNTALGAYAGYYFGPSSSGNVTSADNSVFLGAQTRPAAVGESNQIVIGFDATGLGSNSVVLGNSAVTRTRLQGVVGVGVSPSNTTSGVNGLIVRAGASQTDDLLDLQNSSGIDMVSVNSSGNLMVSSGALGIGTGGTAPEARVEVRTGGGSTKGLLVKGASVQTVNLLEAQDNTSTRLFSVGGSGNVDIPVGEVTISGDNGGLGIGGGRGAARLGVWTANTGQVGIIIRSASTSVNNTVDLMQAYTRNTSATPLARLTAAGTWTSASDARLKTDVMPYGGALDALLRLRGVRYNWRADSNRNPASPSEIGVIAQDIEQVVPEVVHTGSDGFKSVAYDRLAPVFIEGIKAQQSLIEDQDERLEVAEEFLALFDRAAPDTLALVIPKLRSENFAADLALIDSLQATQFVSGQARLGGLTLDGLPVAAQAGDDLLVIGGDDQVRRLALSGLLEGRTWGLAGNAATRDGGLLGAAPTGDFIGTTGLGAAARDLSLVTGNVIRAQIGVDGVLRTEQDIIVNGVRVGRGGGAIASNTAVGDGALGANTLGSRNTAFGLEAGRLTADGTPNATSVGSLFLGAGSRAGGAGQSNQIVIGADAVGLGSDSVVLGNSSITRTRLQGRVGIGADPVGMAGVNGLLVRAGAAQGGRNLLEVQDAAGAALMVVDATGSMSIGTGAVSAAGFKLDVMGDVRVTGAVVANGVTLTSDARFKTNVQAITDALAIVRRLQGVSYDWNRAAFPERGFSSRPQIGVIAQEVEQVLPELVSTDAQGLKSVNYTGFIPVLIEGMKQQATQLDEQGERLAKAENKLGLVEERLFKAEEQFIKLDERVGKAESFIARFDTVSEPETMMVLTPTFKVQNFTADRAYIAELRAERIEADKARFKELDADGAVIDNVEAARLRGRVVNTGGKEIFVSYGSVAPLFDAAADGHYIVSASAEDGSFATAQVINAGGVLRVVPTASQGIDVVADGNSVGLVAPSKKVKASWTRTG